MRFIATIAVILVLASAGLAQSTWYVPDDFPAGIQAAISDPSVAGGDIIIVRPGTYVETITFEGKAITLKSEMGPDVTIIDGNHYQCVVRFTKGEGPDSVLEGFTIYNGKGGSGGLPNCKGGGISCIRNSSPTITGNVISRNMTVNYDDGGGIHCDDSSPTISGNIIDDNYSNDHGGGIYCNDSSATITGNTITGNTTAANEDGGGIYCENSSPTISGNYIHGNIAGDEGGGIYCIRSFATIVGNTIRNNTCMNDEGGGIYCEGTSATIADNTIAYNSADHGAGIHLYVCDDAYLTNNTIHGNTATYTGGGIHSTFTRCRIAGNTIAFNTAGTDGGGIRCYGSPGSYICNTILWDNSSPQGPELYVGQGHALELHCCNVEGGQASVFVESGAALTWGAGMIDADPLFADPGNDDFHLTYDSPCKNAGLNHANLPDHDCEGDPRTFEGRADIGADEYCYHLYHLGRAVPGEWISVRVVGSPGAWVILGQGSGIQDPPEPSSYGPVHIARPWTLQLFGTIPAGGILVVPTPVPAGWTPGEERYFQAAVGGSVTMLTNLMTVEVR